MPDASEFTTYARLLRLDPVHEIALAPQTVARQTVTVPARRWRLQGLLSLLVLVAMPACLAAGYFWLLAADRYVSVAHFVLRTPGRSLDGTEVSSMLQSAGVIRASDDGFIVQDFLQSRDAVSWLEKHSGLRKVLGAGNSDLIWRFPNPFTPDNEEGLYWHFLRMVSTSFDTTTGVSTLSVEAFSPEDAHRLAASLLDAAESLVNRLNERAKHDAIALAESEVDRMKQRALAAQAALTAFRERERLVDPGQVTLAVLETIARLSLDASRVSVQINELGSTSPQAPQIASLRVRRAAIEEQIAKERSRLAGDAQSIAPRIAEYERLMFERDFAGRALMAAMTEAERARVEAQRRQVYLERVSQPSRPDYPAYPWRVVWFLATLAAGYMTFRIWRILATDALRHSEL